MVHRQQLELNNFDVDDFLENYWQKKPLLIKNAFPALRSPLSAEELAGLACEPWVNARLVLEKDGERPWQVEYGPFEESRFAELPEKHWSLLVSDIERHVPQARALYEAFQFIPDWRIDDLMVSYAPEGGSVGPHTDAYDVFLIQLSGVRQWKIAEDYAKETFDDIDLCILKDFKQEEEWLLHTGDMLYLPPNVAHHGIAIKDREYCMTASVGFRAPSLQTITSEYTQFINEFHQSDRRYRDRDVKQAEHHAEITSETVNHFMDYLKQGLEVNEALVQRWLGQYCSDNKAFENLTDSPVQFDTINELYAFHTNNTLTRSAYSNFLFADSADTALLFVNGETYETSKDFARMLCSETSIQINELRNIMTTNDQQILLTLFNAGAITSPEQ